MSDSSAVVELINRVERDIQNRLGEHASSGGHSGELDAVVSEARSLVEEMRGMLSEVRTMIETHSATLAGTVDSVVEGAERGAEAAAESVAEAVEEVLGEGEHIASETEETIVGALPDFLKPDGDDKRPNRTPFFERKIFS